VDHAHVVHALETLETAGARNFDADSCDCIRALLKRATELDERAGSLLTARAHAHLTRLEERLERMRAQTARVLTRLEEEHGELPNARSALARCELLDLRRQLRRRALQPPAANRSLVKTDRITCLQAFEASASELLASFAIARARDVVPEEAGPYNPLRIASDLLERIRDVSPIYLTAQLHRLDELGSMLSLPELPAPPSKIAAKKPRGSLKSGS
jgi:hypothetical protein